MRPRNAKWADEELRKQIADLESKGEWRDDSTLFVMNPIWRDRLSRMIRDDIWPGMKRIIEGAELEVDLCSDDGEPKIAEEIKLQATMSFLMLIGNQKTSSWDRDPYFCRIVIECHANGFFVRTDFYLHFPDDFELEKLKLLMGNPKFSGNPPDLKYESPFDDDEDGVLIVSFEHGKGYSYEVALPVDTMLADFAERINFLRRLIRAVEHMSEDYSDDKRFERVVKELEKCFAAF